MIPKVNQIPWRQAVQRELRRLMKSSPSPQSNSLMIRERFPSTRRNLMISRPKRPIRMMRSKEISTRLPSSRKSVQRFDPVTRRDAMSCSIRSSPCRMPRISSRNFKVTPSCRAQVKLYLLSSRHIIRNSVINTLFTPKESLFPQQRGFNGLISLLLETTQDPNVADQVDTIVEVINDLIESLYDVQNTEM